MKQLVVILTCALALACAGTSRGPSTGPQLEFVQLVGPAEQDYPSGEFEVQFGLKVANGADETITLRQIQVETIASGGPYELQRETYYFNMEVEPKRVRGLSFWAHATAGGGRHAPDARAPVTVRVVALFEAASGRFRRVLVARLAQTPGTAGW